MARLPQIHPTVHEAFMDGKFVVQRGDKKFFMMALDQSHEVSERGQWSKGPLQSARAERSHRTLQPEVLRVISEFESVFYTKSNAKDSLEHPESSAAEQNKFLKHL